MKRKHIFCAFILSAVFLLLSACRLDVRDFANSDDLTIISKSEYTNGKVAYRVQAVVNNGSGATSLYFYSQDRSLDVGDKVKLVKK